LYFFSYSKDNVSGIGIKMDNGSFDFSSALDIYQHSQGNATPVSVTFLQVLVEMEFCSKEAAEEVMNNPWVQAKAGELRLSSTITIEPPIARPGKIIGIGRNYKAHAAELDHNLPEAPLFFSKALTSLTAHNRPIIIPDWVTGRVDHEAELGVVVTREGRHIAENDAMAHVAGYTLVNDITARDMQKTDLAEGAPWFRSKSMDTFCPVGPGILPADSVTDPHNLTIELSVNGETRQHANTGDMLFSIPRLIAEISKYMTLQPGDIIATGTPEGVGPIENGDLLEVSLQGLGTLKNTVQR